jgi:hypothetical protein
MAKWFVDFLTLLSFMIQAMGKKTDQGAAATKART